jgi:hypothetical protein
MDRFSNYSESVAILNKFIARKIDWRKNDPFNKGWVFQIIEKKKHVYENNMHLKALCNSLARVCTPLYIPHSERKKLPGCIAIHLDLLTSDINEEIFHLKKINFSSKRLIGDTKERILKMMKFCFGWEQSFIDSFTKDFIYNKIQNIDKNFVIKNKINGGLNKNQYLEDIAFLNDMKEFLIKIDNYKILESDNIKMKKDVHYIMIICSDLIILQDIFKKQFIEPDNIELILNPISIPIESNLNNVHPDALLACELFNKEKSNNRYIGSTFLCCILCGIFLDRHLFEFCGVSNEYEITWETPPNCEKTSEYENFCNDVNQLMIQVQKKQPPFTAALRHPHFIDSNKRTCGKISDDIEIYKKFYADNYSLGNENEYLHKFSLFLTNLYGEN